MFLKQQQKNSQASNFKQNVRNIWSIK
jgi:hypothetical protein